MLNYNRRRQHKSQEIRQYRPFFCHKRQGQAYMEQSRRNPPEGVNAMSRTILASTFASVALTITPWFWLPFVALVACTVVERLVQRHHARQDAAD